MSPASCAATADRFSRLSLEDSPPLSMAPPFNRAPPLGGPAFHAAANRLTGLPLEKSPPRPLLSGMASPLTVAGISREEPRARQRLRSPVARRAGGLSSHERFLAERLELRQRRPGPPCLRRPLQFSSGLWGPLVLNAPQVRELGVSWLRRRPRAATASGLATGAAPGLCGALSAGILVRQRGPRVPGLLWLGDGAG